MIVVRLKGGFGNQLFQYATGRRLAIRHDTELKLDARFLADLSTGEPRSEFILDGFKIKATLASPEEVEILRDPVVDSYPGFGFDKQLPAAANKPSHILERQFNFQPDILRARDNCLLEGYWTSAKYFADIRELLRFEFTPRSLCKRSMELISQMENLESIAVHVDGGDKSQNTTMGLLPTYYQDALAFIRSRKPESHLFIFSDDPEWYRENLGSCEVATVINTAGQTAHEYVYMMSRCKHFVLSNSTLSWWAAWLADDEKIVIAPRPFSPARSLDESDVYPPQWITIPSVAQEAEALKPL